MPTIARKPAGLHAATLAALVLAAPAAAEEPAPAADPFWRPEELALLDRGLFLINASRADLGFQKRPIDDPFRLPVVDRALDDPLSIGREAQAWDEAAARAAEDGIAPLLHQARDQFRLLVHVRGPLGADPAFGVPGIEARLPAREGAEFAPGDRLSPVLRGIDASAASLRRALDPSDPSARAVLGKTLRSQVESMPMLAETPEMSDAEFVERAAEDLRRGGMNGLPQWLADLTWPVQSLVRSIGTSSPRGEAPWKGRIRSESKAGPVVLYGYGDDVHDPDDDAVLVIDLGGNDTWVRGASASVLKGRPVSIGIDLAGNDRYVGREDLSFGAALGGVAIQWDCAGDDLYDAGHASLGAGICGVGILVDEGGDDVYRCRDFGIGAGAFGIGILLDKGGNDLYHADLHGQGFASTLGVGVLADLDGHDVYDAGGVHVHAPLYADRTRSLSQGFSIGMRPDASGGVGVLIDRRGNDRYAADIYGQGAAYWFGLGLLVDSDGNDT